MSIARKTRPSPARAGWRRNRRGTAMIEFVMALPLLLFVLVGTWFFGWAMMNQQQVRVSDRYTAWREVRGGGRVRPDHLNERFFGERADPISIRRGQGPDWTIQDLIGAAGDRGGQVQAYTEELIWDRFPTSRSARVDARFPSDIDLWNRLEGSIKSRHVREGWEWRRDEADCESAVRDVFLSDLHEELRALPMPANRFGRVVRHLYETTW